MTNEQIAHALKCLTDAKHTEEIGYYAERRMLAFADRLGLAIGQQIANVLDKHLSKED